MLRNGNDARRPIIDQATSPQQKMTLTAPLGIANVHPLIGGEIRERSYNATCNAYPGFAGSLRADACWLLLLGPTVSSISTVPVLPTTVRAAVCRPEYSGLPVLAIASLLIPRAAVVEASSQPG